VSARRMTVAVRVMPNVRPTDKPRNNAYPSGTELIWRLGKPA
jgi:hypothetical protein